MMPFRACVVVVAALTVGKIPPCVAAQTSAEHVVLGDRALAARDGVLALRHYEDAVKADPNAIEARLKATAAAVDLGEYHPAMKERERLYVLAAAHARRAVDEHPAHADARFQLARALGRRALSLDSRERVKFAVEIRTQALESLRLDPTHPGALHVMGMWNYNIMQTNGLTRFLVRRFLGGKVFDTASWDDAQRFMEESVRVEPNRIVHHLDLGRVYAARSLREKARAQFGLAIAGPMRDYNDAAYRAEAAEELKRLR